MFEAGLEALLILIQPARLAYMLLGTSIGIVVGILPGLGGAVGMSIVLPFVFGMDPYSGMALLMGMVAVIHTADTFSSVLLGIPGSSGSQATIMDGYPLAKQGQASRALGAAFMASIIGGLFGAVVLFFTVSAARPLVLALRSPELFMLALLGLSMVGILSRGSALKGVGAGVLGLLIGVIGSAPAVSEYRFTFDSIYLFDGIPLPVLALGLFALPEFIELLIRNKSISEKPELSGSMLQGIKDTLHHKWLVLRSSVIGVLVGIVPGLGGPVVDWISYGIAMRTCKNSEGFGKGDIRGVIAPESSNNAKESGALVPTMLFGIPGSSTTAILLGGLILMGIEAGPRMVTTDLTVMLTIIWTLAIANVLGGFICIGLSKFVAKIAVIPGKVLVPFLMVVMVVASYQSTRHWGDIVSFIVIGVLGWVMKEGDWPRAPLIIGFVLSNPAERYLHISMSRYGFSWLASPIVIGIGLFIIFLLVYGIRGGGKGGMLKNAEESVSEKMKGRDGDA